MSITGTGYQVEMAKALVRSLVEGDSSVGEQTLTDSYIQHNLEYASGKQAFLDATQYFANQSVKSSVEVVRGFSDHNHVVLHCIYNFAGAGDVVAFDIFRFEGDQIAEHWDNIQPYAGINPSGRSQVDGDVELKDFEQTLQNKDLVKEFLENVLIGGDYGAMGNYFDGDRYIQHNPMIADGLSGLGVGLEELGKIGKNMVFKNLHMLFGEGNFVISVMEGYFGEEHTAFYDLFRIEEGKIAEHWDVVAPIPDKSSWKNNNGKF